jgi:hypothetical protein
VPLDFCSCKEGRTPLAPGLARPLATAVLADIDAYLSPLWGCQQLELVNVTKASMRKEGNTQMIEAQVTVAPRQASFTISIFHETRPEPSLDSEAGEELATNASSVSARVTRQDIYSGTSECLPLQHRMARPYCICR